MAPLRSSHLLRRNHGYASNTTHRSSSALSWVPQAYPFWCIPNASFVHVKQSEFTTEHFTCTSFDFHMKFSVHLIHKLEENVARSSGWFSQAAHYLHSRITIVRIVGLGFEDQEPAALRLPYRRIAVVFPAPNSPFSTTSGRRRQVQLVC